MRFTPKIAGIIGIGIGLTLSLTYIILHPFTGNFYIDGVQTFVTTYNHCYTMDEEFVLACRTTALRAMDLADLVFFQYDLMFALVAILMVAVLTLAVLVDRYNKSSEGKP